MGVNDDKVEDVLSILKDNTKPRKELSDDRLKNFDASKVMVGGATVFIINAEKFKKV